ncbi:MAG: methyltransferase [Alphaproteobacteria bacterium]|nr:methyltransferase [Alphaproteobacteria bacterium]
MTSQLTANKIDSLLSGRVKIAQAKDYKATIDSVLLADFVLRHYNDNGNSKRGHRNKQPSAIAELGVGTGAVMLCVLHYFARYNIGVDYDGYDCNQHFLDLAQESLRLNGYDAPNIMLHHCDIRDISNRNCYDAVVMNPPFLAFDEQAGMERANMRSRALYEGEVKLADWLNMAGKLLNQQGWLFMVHQAERLSEIIVHMQKFGAITIMPIHSYHEKAAKRILLAAQLGSKAGVRIMPSLVMHDAGGDYTAQAQKILQGE